MIGNILRRLRESKKVTQAGMAEFLGIDRSTYTKYESGKSKPDADMLIKIADYFGVSVDYLLERTDVPAVKEQTARYKVNSDLNVSGLPDEAVKQAKEYIDFLKHKYKHGESKKGE